MKIIASSDDPVFARDEPAGTHGHVRDVKCPQQRRRLVIVDVDLAIVEGTHDPALGGMEVDGLDAVGAAGQQFLDLGALDLDAAISGHNGNRAMGVEGNVPFWRAGEGNRATRGRGGTALSISLYFTRHCVGVGS